MLVDGRLIAQKIFAKLKGEVNKLKTKPHLAVILVGEDPVWKVYVGQKLKKGEEIGARVSIRYQVSGIRNQELLQLIIRLNRNKNIHGVIVQRPLPPQIDLKKLALAVIPEKDVDGFHPQTLYPMPVAAAVIAILKEINHQITRSHLDQVSSRQGGASFSDWLKAKNIVVIGKGETAGKPTAIAISKLGAVPTVIDSKTPNSEKLIKRADIVISCVGKPEIVRPEMLKKSVILIGVGLHRDPAGKLAGDYEEEEIKDIASFYTPIPGGVGPVNVACLFKNLVTATKNSSSN